MIELVEVTAVEDIVAEALAEDMEAFITLIMLILGTQGEISWIRNRNSWDMME